MWIPSQRTLAWRLGRIEGADAEAGDLVVALGERRYEKGFQASEDWVRRSPVRPDGSFLDQLIYPAEPPLPAAGPVERIQFELPSAEVDVLGFTVREMAGVPAWMIVYFLLAVIFAFALRKPMGVEI